MMLLHVTLQKEIETRQDGLEFLRLLKNAEANHHLINVRIRTQQVEQIDLKDIPDA